MSIVPHPPTDMLEVQHRGPATVGAVGRARLHGREGEIGEMFWEALRRAGWVGEKVSLRTIVSLQVRVVEATPDEPAKRSRFETLPGTRRTRLEKGWIDEEHMACQRYEGPLNGRAAGPGYRLLESERRPEDLESGEDVLYTAAVRAGWLAADRDEIVDVGDVHVTIGVNRRRADHEAVSG